MVFRKMFKTGVNIVAGALVARYFALFSRKTIEQYSIKNSSDSHVDLICDVTQHNFVQGDLGNCSMIAQWRRYLAIANYTIEWCQKKLTATLLRSTTTLSWNSSSPLQIWKALKSSRRPKFADLLKCEIKIMQKLQKR